MSLQAKLTLLTTLILSVTLIFSSVIYLENLDTLFKEQTRANLEHDREKVANHFSGLKRQLSDVTARAAEDIQIKAPLYLLSRYQTAAGTFEHEKRKMQEYLQRWFHPRLDTAIAVFDTQRRLVAIARKDNARLNGYVSLDKEGDRGFVDPRGRWVGENDLATLSTLETAAMERVKGVYEKGVYKLIKTQKVISNDQKAGYIQLCYYFGPAQMEKLNRDLIYRGYFQIAKNRYILPEGYGDKLLAQGKSEDFALNRMAVERPFEKGQLSLHLLVDKRMIRQQRSDTIIKLISVWVLTILAVYGISWLFSRRFFTTPIAQLRSAIKSIKQHRYEEITVQSNDELGKIIKEFNTLFTQLSKNYASLESYKQAMDAGSIVSKSDRSGKITYVNEKFCQVSGYSKEELLGKPHNIIRHPDMPAEAFRKMWETIEGKRIWKGIVKNRRKDGSYYWIDSVICPILNENGEIEEYIAVRRDITELVDKRQELQNIVDYDQLTDLGTRHKLHNDLEKSKQGCLAVINLDRFRQINDLYGHSFGDRVIRAVAKQMQAAVHGDYNLYRLQGDEFVVTAPWRLKGEFVQKIEQLINALENYGFTFDKEEVSITVSAGISFELPHSQLLTADMALRIAKKQGRSYIVYSSENSLNSVYENNIKWTKKLKAAIAEDRIVPFFQPIVNNETMAYEKYECLVRMLDEEQGKVVSPFFFLDIAKKTKQYSQLTRIMARKSFETFRNRSEQFSLNVTVEDIVNDEIRNYLYALLQEYSIGERVVFEIVESESIDNYEQVISFIETVKAQGCKIAIDDFGTGYSNFEYLLRLKADLIKIDGSLIKHLDSSREAQIVVGVIVDFAKQMGIQIVAEFVENEQILEKLKAMGIEYSQGYHFSAPLQTLK